MNEPRAEYSLLKAAGAALLCAVLIAWLLLVTGCGPRPASDLVLYEQPSPELAAKAHVKERDGLICGSTSGKSMEPLIVAGDWYVADVAAKFSDIKTGNVLIYVPDWSPNSFVIHMAASRSGDGWIMDGINNAHYEGGSQVMLARHYWGTVLKVYTKRKKT